MAQFAVVIDASDSAHAPDATAADTETCDDHADELADTGAMVLAYALTPRGHGVIRARERSHRRAVRRRPRDRAGSYILEAPDLDAAPAIAATDPAVQEGGKVEVRPVHSGGVSTGPAH